MKYAEGQTRLMLIALGQPTGENSPRRYEGDESYKQIAIDHANSTLKNHFREEFSSYYVVNYDTIRSVPTGKGTHQGYSDSSTWSRG